MKLLITILFLFFITYANAISYQAFYVSNSGNDANDGGSPATAWKTIAKVNAMTFVDGDSILFQAGGSWNEKLIPNHSGIYFGSYGTGAQPIITGFQSLVVSSIGGNIYEATASAASPTLNAVLVNGVFAAKGRYPNTGVKTFSRLSRDTLFAIGLTGDTNYSSLHAEIVVRSSNYVWDVQGIASQNTDTIRVKPAYTYNGGADTIWFSSPIAYSTDGYFFQNYVGALDTANEWCINYSTMLFDVYSSTGTPTIQVSTIDTLIVCRPGINNLTFDNLNVQGGNICNIWSGGNNSVNQGDTSITIKNCTIKYGGQKGLGSYWTKNWQILNCNISDCFSCGIYNPKLGDFTTTSQDSTVISGDTIRRIFIFPGMAQHTEYTRSLAILSYGRYNHIFNNILDSVGYDGIYEAGRMATVESNYIKDYCFNLDDGGGIYNSYSGTTDSGNVIKNNIIVNGIMAPAGRSLQGFITCACGIYFDIWSSYQTADSNTIINPGNLGINMDEANNLTMNYNTIYNNEGYLMFIQAKNTDSTFNIVASHNNFIQLGTSVLSPGTIAGPIYPYSVYKQWADYYTMDSNYYHIPISSLYNFYYNGTSYKFSQWQSVTGQDAHSTTQPDFIVGYYDPIIPYNPTLSDSTIILGGNYVDHLGNVYYGSITLHSFHSAVLYPYFSRKISLIYVL